MRLVLLASAAVLALSAGAHAAPSRLGFDLAGRDTMVKPGDSFFRYANGTFVDQLAIPADRTSYGSFVKLAELSETRVHGILDEQQAAGGAQTTAPAKFAAFFHAFMDQAAVDRAGAQPMQADLAAIRAIATPADFARLNGHASVSLMDTLFALVITPDSKDPTKYTIGLAQNGLGLPDRDYYLAKDFADKRAEYQRYAARALSLAGWPDADAAAARVVAFETQVAQASWSRTDSRDDDKTYNPITLDALIAAAPGFDWHAYFDGARLGTPATVVLGQNTAIDKIAAVAGRTPIGTLRDWAALHLVMDASPYLSSQFVDARFAFFNHTLQGQPQDRPRWKRGVDATELAMGDAIGRVYAERYFPASARAKMDGLTADLRTAFRNRLEHNTWMAPQTRAKALQKLATFYFLVGYPKHWRDYGGLVVKSDDLYGNITRATAFEWEFWVSHLGHPVDREQWAMFPQTVNAYNEPLLNEVVFPAAILQPPFFDPAADSAINYGGIGGVIGHEMTHSFDDQGRKHDALGRLNNWWTAEDVTRFDARAKQYGAQFAQMDLGSGAHINPDLTMGENIADLGGLTLALDAYHDSLHGKPAPVIDGLTGDQRVFLGWAQVWRMKVRPDRARQMLTIDPHSPPMARVNGPMHNIDAWYQAFDVKPGETLYLAPDQRVRIW